MPQLSDKAPTVQQCPYCQARPQQVGLALAPALALALFIALALALAPFLALALVLALFSLSSPGVLWPYCT